MITKTLHVPSIHCHHCTMTIERELKELPGVTAVTADVESKTVTVGWDAPATEEGVKGLLEEINYPVAE